MCVLGVEGEGGVDLSVKDASHRGNSGTERRGRRLLSEVKKLRKSGRQREHKAAAPLATLTNNCPQISLGLLDEKTLNVSSCCFFFFCRLPFLSAAKCRACIPVLTLL